MALGSTLYHIEAPYNDFANRADADQAALVSFLQYSRKNGLNGFRTE